MSLSLSLDTSKGIHVSIKLYSYTASVNKKEFFLNALNNAKCFGDQYDDMCLAQVRMYVEQLPTEEPDHFGDSFIYKKIRNQYVMLLNFVVEDCSKFCDNFEGWMYCLPFDDGYRDNNSIHITMSYMDHNRIFWPNLTILSDRESYITERDG